MPALHAVLRTLVHCFAPLAAALLVAAPASAQPAPRSPTMGQMGQMGYIVPTAPADSWSGIEVEAPPPPAPRADAPTPSPAPPSSAALDVAVATEVPIMVGAQATLELPFRLLLQGEVGVLPGAYVDTADSALVASGSYDQNTSALVRSSMKDSLIVRLSGGFRPFEGHGLEIMGGYTLSSLGAGMSARQAIESAAGITLPAEIPDGEIQLKTTIHSAHVSLGWRWVLGEHFVVRSSIGYMQAVSSSSHLEVPATIAAVPAVAARLDQVNQAVDTALNNTYTTYVKLPVVGLSLGYRF